MLEVNVLIGEMFWSECGNGGMLGVNVLIGVMLGVNTLIGAI